MLALLAAALLVLPAGPAGAAAPPPEPGALTLPEPEQLALARSLLAEGDYFRAISEFKRFLFFFPHSPEAPEARFAIGDALLAAGRYREAEAAFAELRAACPQGTPGDRALLGEALALLKEGRRHEGRELLRRLAGDPASPYRGRAGVELALSLAEEGKWNEAQAALRETVPPGAALDRRLNVLQSREAQAKSPALAGLLSALLPGAGQAWCGRVRDGALALLVNGLFIWGAAEAGTRGNVGLAAGLSLIEAAWYGGTIYGAVNCAYRQQMEEAGRAREQLERLPEAGRGVTLAWGYRF